MSFLNSKKFLAFTFSVSTLITLTGFDIYATDSLDDLLKEADRALEKKEVSKDSSPKSENLPQRRVKRSQTVTSPVESEALGENSTPVSAPTLTPGSLSEILEVDRRTSLEQQSKQTSLGSFSIGPSYLMRQSLSPLVKDEDEFRYAPNVSTLGLSAHFLAHRRSSQGALAMHYGMTASFFKSVESAQRRGVENRDETLSLLTLVNTLFLGTSFFTHTPLSFDASLGLSAVFLNQAGDTDSNSILEIRPSPTASLAANYNVRKSLSASLRFDQIGFSSSQARRIHARQWTLGAQWQVSL